MTWQQFQRKVCTDLSDKGFWAYETINKPQGQPVDIIAAKSNVCYIIECKATQTDRFPLNRVEDNQITAIEKFKRCGNSECWFAFYFAKHENDILYIKAEQIIDMIDDDIKSVSYEELRQIRREIQ